jgi:regulator of cell morphogenesis and NO signaling
MDRRTVAEIAAESMAAVRVFERHGIEYGCAGKRPLVEICREKGIDPVAIETEVQRALTQTEARTLHHESVADLIQHVLSAHHEFLKQELPRISARLEKVARGHGNSNPRLRQLVPVFRELREHLETHMEVQETAVFPSIAAGKCLTSPDTSLDRVCSEELGLMRSLTSGYSVPEGACNGYRALLTGMREVDEDLQIHMRIETEFLPKAVTA